MLFEEDFDIEITYNEKSFVFRTLKGNIYCNRQLYCDNSYHYFEKQSTFGKLLDVIKEILS